MNNGPTTSELPPHLVQRHRLRENVGGVVLAREPEFPDGLLDPQNWSFPTIRDGSCSAGVDMDDKTHLPPQISQAAFTKARCSASPLAPDVDRQTRTHPAERPREPEKLEQAANQPFQFSPGSFQWGVADFSSPLESASNPMPSSEDVRSIFLSHPATLTSTHRVLFGGLPDLRHDLRHLPTSPWRPALLSLHVAECAWPRMTDAHPFASRTPSRLFQGALILFLDGVCGVVRPLVRYTTDRIWPSPRRV